MIEHIVLEKMPNLAELFRWFNAGKHLNRVSEPKLWFELEQKQNSYQNLFTALGYELRIDERGFAWFHNTESSFSVSKQSKELALLFMTILDTQADLGQALNLFTQWRIDTDLLVQVFEQHQELLAAENIDLEGMHKLLERAESLGFSRQQNDYWELLPAVNRYLDHILALDKQKQDDETSLHVLDDFENDDELIDSQEEALEQ